MFLSHSVWKIPTLLDSAVLCYHQRHIFDAELTMFVVMEGVTTVMLGKKGRNLTLNMGNIK